MGAVWVRELTIFALVAKLSSVFVLAFAFHIVLGCFDALSVIVADFRGAPGHVQRADCVLLIIPRGLVPSLALFAKLPSVGWSTDALVAAFINFEHRVRVALGRSTINTATLTYIGIHTVASLDLNISNIGLGILDIVVNYSPNHFAL